jgi:hypothetical protein
MPEPHTRETINLTDGRPALLALVRDRPVALLTSVAVALVLLGSVIQQMISVPLTTPPPPVVSASATLPALTQAYPHAFTRAVSVYDEPDRDRYRGPVETGRRYALVARSGSAWYLLDIQGSGAGWVPGEFLAQPAPALLPDLATPVVEVVEVQIVVTATPQPTVVPVAPAPVVPVVPVAMPSATPWPTIVPPSPVPEFATAAPTYPILIRGEPRYMRDVVTPSVMVER